MGIAQVKKCFLVPALFLLGCLSFYHHLFLEKMERTKTSNLLNLLTPVVLHKKTVLVKKRHFYVKKLFFYKLNGCKNTAFLQKHISVKKLLFYVNSLLFYRNIFL